MPPFVIGGAFYGVGELMAGAAFVGSAVGSGVVVGNAVASHNSNQSTQPPATPAQQSQQAKDGATKELSPTTEDCGTGNCDDDQAKDSKRENKKKHIFGKAQHELDGLLQSFGGDQDEALDAIQQEAQNLGQGTSGPFSGVANINGYDVTIKGAMVNGNAEVGTAYVAPSPLMTGP